MVDKCAKYKALSRHVIDVMVLKGNNVNTRRELFDDTFYYFLCFFRQHPIIAADTDTAKGEEGN